MKNRISYDEYFMRIARTVSIRATCNRLHVGAVIVKDNLILSTGYNGASKGLVHCDDNLHMMKNNHCVRTVHAEANAIVNAAYNGISIKKGTLYVTASPCWDCFKLIINAGIIRVVYDEFYREQRVFDVAKKVGVKMIKHEGEKE
jgi:dCMP deaminase